MLSLGLTFFFFFFFWGGSEIPLLINLNEVSAFLLLLHLRNFASMRLALGLIIARISLLPLPLCVDAIGL